MGWIKLAFIRPELSRYAMFTYTRCMRGFHRRNSSQYTALVYSSGYFCINFSLKNLIIAWHTLAKVGKVTSLYMPLGRQSGNL